MEHATTRRTVLAGIGTAALVSPAALAQAPLAIGDDSEILALAKRHADLAAVLDATPAGPDDEDAFDAMMDECCAVAYAIAAAPARTLEGYKIKVRTALWLNNWENPAATAAAPNGADEEIALQVFRFVLALEA